MSVIQNIWRGGYRATITSVYSFMILWEWYWAKDNKNPSKELASCEHMCESLSRWGRGGRRVTGDPRGSRGDEHSAQNFNLHRNSPVPQSPASSDLGQCRSLSALVTPLFSEIPISSITRFSGTFVTYCLPLTPAQLDYELSEGMNLFKMYQKKKKNQKGGFYYFSILFFHLGRFSQELRHALCNAVGVSAWMSSPEGRCPYYRLKPKQLAHPRWLTAAKGTRR